METKKKPHTEYEKQLMLQLIASQIDFLDNRKTDGVSHKKKMEAWVNVTNEFNNSPNILQTITPKQMKKMWQNFKTKTREAKTLETQKRKTGGGPPPPDMPPTATQVLSIMPSIMPTIKVPIDSDFSTAQNEEDGDDDSPYWLPKKRRTEDTSEILLEVFEEPTAIPVTEPTGTAVIEPIPFTVIERTAATDIEVTNSKKKPTKEPSQEKVHNLNKKMDLMNLSFEDLKKKLLIQEFENNKIRFENELQKSNELFILEKENKLKEHQKNMELLELKKKILLKEL